jgi:mevalonate kinase
MAKIVQTITRPSREYKKEVFDSIIRDIDAIVQKLNSTFQQDLKEELERKELFMNRYAG